MQCSASASICRWRNCGPHSARAATHPCARTAVPHRLVHRRLVDDQAAKGGHGQQKDLSAFASAMSRGRACRGDAHTSSSSEKPVSEVTMSTEEDFSVAARGADHA
jgi:hypothetical protein